MIGKAPRLVGLDVNAVSPFWHNKCVRRYRGILTEIRNPGLRVGGKECRTFGVFTKYRGRGKVENRGMRTLSASHRGGIYGIYC